MNRFPASVVFALLCAATLRGWSATPEKPSVPSEKDGKAVKIAPTEFQFVTSSFNDDSNEDKFGQDIFFPKTKRFTKKVETPVVGPVKGENPLISQLVLKGISGTAGHPLALVNTRTLAPGEIWEFKYNGQVHHITCEEIKTRSVVLSIEGLDEKKEIHLRDGL